MRNWKTTTCAGISAFFMFVLFSPNLFLPWPWVVEVAKFASIGGLLAFGIAAKDYNVSGQNPSNRDNASK